MSSMKILIVSDYYPPYIGGGQRQTQLIAKELTDREYDVQVATLWRPGMPDTEYDDSIIVHRVKQIRSMFSTNTEAEPHPPPFPDPVMLLRLRQIIKTFKPDIIHSYGWITYACSVAMTGMNIPLIISARDYGYTCPSRIMLYKGRTCSGPNLMKCLRCSPDEFGFVKGSIATIGVSLGRSLLRHQTDGVHSVSAFVETTTLSDLYGQGNAADIPRKVIHSFRVEHTEQGEFTQAEKDIIATLPKEPFILFVGNLRLVKGIHLLLEAYSRLDSPPKLVVMGSKVRDTPDFPETVQVHYSVPHKVVMEAWSRCLFGVAPSIWPEPFGSVVHEGMSAGKAVIGTQPGGHSDMIQHRENGILVPSGNVEALTEALQELIADSDLRERLAEAARNDATKFTAETSIPKLLKLYQEALNRSQHKD